MSVSSISSALDYVASSYNSTQTTLATSLAQLGSQKRFQTAGDDLNAFLATNQLNAQSTQLQASQASANTALGAMNAYDDWATSVLNALNTLKQTIGANPGTTTAPSAAVTNAQKAIGAMLNQTYDGSAMTAGIAGNFMMADGTTQNYSTGGAAPATLTATAGLSSVGAIDTAIGDFTTNIQAAVANKSAAQMTQSYASAMSQNFQAAASTISGIDEAAVMAQYNAANIQQQESLSMITQGNVAREQVLLLFK